MPAPDRTLWILGCRGQLGHVLGERFAGSRIVAHDLPELDVADADAVEREIDRVRPDAVLNAAAYTPVDRAEDEPDVAARANALGPAVLAEACRRRGALLVHFSTDYVFDGEAGRPYLEEDEPRPRGVYGRTKLEGEIAVRRIAPPHLIVRTAALFGRPGPGGKAGNFVETMLRLGAEGRRLRVVDDQTTSPTWAADLAATTAEIVARWWSSHDPALLGLYHVTNAGQATWLELAREIFRQAGMAVTVEPTTTAEYGAKAPRPAFSALAHGHLERAGIPSPRPWPEALAGYLASRG